MFLFHGCKKMNVMVLCIKCMFFLRVFMLLIRLLVQKKKKDQVACDESKWYKGVLKQHINPSYKTILLASTITKIYNKAM